MRFITTGEAIGRVLSMPCTGGGPSPDVYVERDRVTSLLCVAVELFRQHNIEMPRELLAWSIIHDEEDKKRIASEKATEKYHRERLKRLIETAERELSELESKK